jgi:hypothetical protein
VGHDILNHADIVLDCEIKAPIVIHSGLPNILGFIVFLGVQRWMLKIACKKANLF